VTAPNTGGTHVALTAVVTRRNGSDTGDEIIRAVQTVIRGCEALDMEMAFRIFWNSPDFRMISMDGRLCDYQTYIQDNIEYLKTCAQFTLTTLTQEITVFTRTLAICSWIYRVDATLKTGEHDRIDHAGASFVFRKIEDEWKVVYYQESTLPPMRTTE
jgi:hypothetical protein